MQNWQSSIKLKKDQNSVKTSSIKTGCGIFQGDPLRDLWFCLTMNPLSNALDEKGYGKPNI
jgi:hypothetical protein